MFTTAQAIAILQAERVLESVGDGRPGCIKGTPWYDLVSQALDMVDDEFNDLTMVREIKGLGAFDLDALMMKAVQLGRVSQAGRIAKQIRYASGWKDRCASNGCRSSDGAYLDGYYRGCNDLLYFVSGNELNALRDHTN